MSSRATGSHVRTHIDPAAFRRAAAGIGTDLRYWCSHGTVCTIDPESGELDYADQRAIWNGPEGVEVDVDLEPLGQHVTCLYAGIQAGEATIFAPIRPGDRVLVACPDGDLTTPVVIAILQSKSNKQPLGSDYKPIFQNDRLLIQTKTVPVDIRTAGGVQVLLDQQGNATITATSVKLGGPSASEPLVLGNQWRELMASVLTALYTHVHVGVLTGGGTSGPSPGLAAFPNDVANLPAQLSTTCVTK